MRRLIALLCFAILCSICACQSPKRLSCETFSVKCPEGCVSFSQYDLLGGKKDYERDRIIRIIPEKKLEFAAFGSAQPYFILEYSSKESISSDSPQYTFPDGRNKTDTELVREILTSVRIKR